MGNKRHRTFSGVKIKFTAGFPAAATRTRRPWKEQLETSSLSSLCTAARLLLILKEDGGLILEDGNLQVHWTRTPRNSLELSLLKAGTLGVSLHSKTPAPLTQGLMFMPTYIFYMDFPNTLLFLSNQPTSRIVGILTLVVTLLHDIDDYWATKQFM